MLIQGKGMWCKIVGAPHVNKFSESKQWSFDLEVDKATQKQLFEAGMSKTYLRDKDGTREPFISFVRDETKKDGSEGQPFKVVDAQNQPWPEGKLIGNGSTLNVVMTLNEREYKGKKLLKPSAIAVQVWELNKYEAKDRGFPTKPPEEITDEDEPVKKDW